MEEESVFDLIDLARYAVDEDINISGIPGFIPRRHPPFRGDAGTSEGRG